MPVKKLRVGNAVEWNKSCDEDVVSNSIKKMVLEIVREIGFPYVWLSRLVLRMGEDIEREARAV